jgi:hypothetical protein
MAVGRFDATGSIRVSLGRLSAPARARVGLTGPRPPALSATVTTGLRGYTTAPKLLPRTGGVLTTTITPIAAVDEACARAARQSATCTWRWT